MDSMHVHSSRSSARHLAGALLILCAVGCSTTGDERSHEATPVPADIAYTVERGDALAAIAARFTGDATTWRAIAAHNGIDDPRRLAVGQRIEIPASLIPEPSAAAAVRTAEPAPRSERSSGADLRASEPEPPSLPEAREPVVISAVTTNRRFELDPLEQARFQGADRLVRVIGTYYPIALYSEPRNGSRLAQRVAPGTVFELQRELGDWLQVNTEAGREYLRRTDGEILSRRDVPAGTQ